MGVEITYLGQSSFKVKGKQASVVVEPHGSAEADILTFGKYGKESKATGFRIDGPGEYEIKEVSVIGVANGDKTIYVIEVEGLRVCYVGGVSQKLVQDQLEEMGSIDILLLPVGGEGEADPKLAVEVLRQVDPWIAIPTLGETANFLKELGKENIEPVAKLSITSEKLPSELTVMLLEKK